MTTRHAIAWAHGMASVQALGGMLGPVTFLLPDGRQVSPLHVAPWFSEPTRSTHPPILQDLRGEWPCVPFGTDVPRTLPQYWSATGETFDGANIPHGHSSNTEWAFTNIAPDRVELTCDYPATHPIRRLTRTIAADPNAAAVDITLTVQARRPCRLPIGLHPTLRLPTTGQARLAPPAFRKGRVFPLDVEPGQGLLQPGATFSDLATVPRRDSRTLSLAQLPLPDNTEELVQLCGVTGGFRLHHPDDWHVTLDWDTQHFPSLLLWISNRGRAYAPWNSRHVALGVEPVCAAFDLGPAVSNAPNPISATGTLTAHAFDPEHPFTTRYRIGVSA
ncbi:MAG: hypothetical protein Q8M59_03525 [Tabrizicola sp.]|uniref:hypothetical protein n=1 Tax=Tabrizicola sp. TaxID=2005166 RepID=UPI002734CBFC|nr:hypothetical protein [Tabrizicola sp.]MDP3262011.1 hypothetical protein [Tabrizicola sp.]